MKFVNVSIDGRNCKGIYLYYDDGVNIIDNAELKPLHNEWKFQVRTKVNGKTGKKVYTYKTKLYTSVRKCQKEI